MLVVPIPALAPEPTLVARDFIRLMTKGDGAQGERRGTGRRDALLGRDRALRCVDSDLERSFECQCGFISFCEHSNKRRAAVPP